jgi:hypothetical protein
MSGDDSGNEDDGNSLARYDAEGGDRESITSRTSHNNPLSRIFTRIKPSHASGAASSRRNSEVVHSAMAAVPNIALSVIAHDMTTPTIATLQVPTVVGHDRRKRSRHGRVSIKNVSMTTVVDGVMPVKTLGSTQQNAALPPPPLPPPVSFDQQLLFDQLDDDHRRRAKRKLRMSKRFYEFYVAPITTFWAFCLTYSAFLILLTYVCLVRTPYAMQPADWLLFVYVLNIGLEQVRKVCGACLPTGVKTCMRRCLWPSRRCSAKSYPHTCRIIGIV